MAGRPKKNPGARAMAAQALWRVEVQGAFADITLDAMFDERRPPPRERALAAELVYGVLRWRRLLDHYLAQVSDRGLDKVEPRARIALRLGAYQLLFLDRVPARAAVNESVSLAPERARGFVNAVLRSLSRRPDELSGPEEIEDPVERISVAESHPRWMVEDWIGRLGPEGAKELCRANNGIPPLTLRVNALRTGRDAFIRLLMRQGVEASAGRWSPLAALIRGHIAVASLPGYDQGLFAVQDEASQLVPLVLGPRPGESVLDACAAPGAKSLQIMEMMGGRGKVLALDVKKSRLDRMKGEAMRLGIKNVTRLAADARRPLREKGKAGRNKLPRKFEGVVFDRALVDAPCTGLGTIRRRPEIKWRRKQGDAAERGELQREILISVAKALKPGGVLVYSTCTFTTEENEQAVAPLLHSGEFSLLDPAEDLPQVAGLVENKMLRTWPHLTGTDGFTVFKLKKTGVRP